MFWVTRALKVSLSYVWKTLLLLESKLTLETKIYLKSIKMHSTLKLRLSSKLWLPLTSESDTDVAIAFVIPTSSTLKTRLCDLWVFQFAAYKRIVVLHVNKQCPLDSKKKSHSKRTPTLWQKLFESGIRQYKPWCHFLKPNCNALTITCGHFYYEMQR